MTPLSRSQSTRVSPTRDAGTFRANRGARWLVRAVVAVGFLALGACTTRSAIYENCDPEQVWVAMQAAAMEPRPADWIVLENEVYADDETRRIEIYRRLRRDFTGPGVQSTRENREFRLRATLGQAKDGDPEVTVVSRDSAIPAHAWTEIERYLDEIDELLGGDPGSADLAPTPLLPQE